MNTKYKLYLSKRCLGTFDTKEEAEGVALEIKWILLCKVQIEEVQTEEETSLSA